MMNSVQATWPINILENAGGLDAVFSRLSKQARESMYGWYFDDLNRTPSSLIVTDAELDSSFEELLPKLERDLKLDRAGARDVVRQLILRVYTLLSQDGDLPPHEGLKSTSLLISHGHLPRLFPSTERPAEVLPITDAMAW